MNKYKIAVILCLFLGTTAQAQIGSMVRKATREAKQQVVQKMQPSSTFTFDSLPANVEEMEAYGIDNKDPYQIAALMVVAFCRYPENNDDCIAMLQRLMNPAAPEIGTYSLNFIKNRFCDKDYVPRSYFKGANPGNNYTPQQPYEITVQENPHSRDGGDDSLTLYVTSGGADSPRPISLRKKPSTGEWFLTESSWNGLLAGIRLPASEDAWY